MSSASTKQAQYEQGGVPELWVVDLPRRDFRHFILENGAYQRVDPEPDGTVVSRAVEVFCLRVDWLFAGPAFPSSLYVVQGLLAA